MEFVTCARVRLDKRPKSFPYAGGTSGTVVDGDTHQSVPLINLSGPVSDFTCIGEPRQANDARSADRQAAGRTSRVVRSRTVTSYIVHRRRRKSYGERAAADAEIGDAACIAVQMLPKTASHSMHARLSICQSICLSSQWLAGVCVHAYVHTLGKRPDPSHTDKTLSNA